MKTAVTINNCQILANDRSKITVKHQQNNTTTKHTEVTNERLNNSKGSSDTIEAP